MSGLTQCTIPPAGWYCSRGAGHDGPCAATCSAYRYGKWTIDYHPKPIPTRKFDYSFWHDDYDGAPDAFDNRAGTAGSVEDAKAEIDMIEDMERDLSPAEDEWVNDATQRAVLMMDNQRLRAALEGLRPIIDTAESNASGYPEWEFVRARVAAAREAMWPVQPNHHHRSSGVRDEETGR